MGLITELMGLVFGGGRNVLTETAHVFRENSENAGVRGAAVQAEVLRQFAAEFKQPRKSAFDSLIDGVNRLPRPLMALGTLGLLCSAMVDPVWFASRMQGIALVPEPLWWLLGAIVSFYFGARHQVKGQEFQRSIADTLARTGDVTNNIKALEALTKGGPSAPKPPSITSAKAPSQPTARVSSQPLETQNAALLDWQAQYGT